MKSEFDEHNSIIDKKAFENICDSFKINSENEKKTLFNIMLEYESQIKEMLGRNNSVSFLEKSEYRKLVKKILVIALYAHVNNDDTILDAFLNLDSNKLLDISKEHPDTFSFSSKKLEKLDYPIDKINGNVWALLEGGTTEGQIAFDMGNIAGKEAIVLYSINFDELENDITITKKLTSFDKRVYIAIAGIYNNGDKYTSLRKIALAMGYTSAPNSRTLNQINDSITKMTNANIYIDNTKESNVSNYKKFKFDGKLLHADRITATINGQMSEAVIRIFTEPALVAFARGRKQVTTITTKMLQSPVNKNENNLAIEDYLIERIMRAKAGNQPKRILYKTIFEKVKITGDKQKSRAKDKIKRYLDHYKACKELKSYIEDKDGITLVF